MAQLPVIDNLTSNEFVYHRFVLVTGKIAFFAHLDETATPYISVDTPSFPTQVFPISPTTGAWKALVHLQPGPQTITFAFNGDQDASAKVENVAYLPLLHVPPLHLALMVASDSKQRMDCPQEKAASPSHSDVEAAKSKMRMWAYMCQAFIAEEMRKNGFGRRSFRLDEEWAQDTLSFKDEEPTFRVTAKVHVVPTVLDTLQLREPGMSLPDPHGNSETLFHTFQIALQQYGGPFKTYRGDSSPPVVAGHIFDSHFDPESGVITGHLAYGAKEEGKFSLGMFGSHSHWAWPRFVEEIAPCLLDSKRVTERSGVANENGESGTFWEACVMGQGGALQQVCSGLGLRKQPTGIMQRGYVDWNRSFVARESYSARRKSPAAASVPAETENRFHLADMLQLAAHPLFALPGDKPAAEPVPLFTVPQHDGVRFASAAGIALIAWERGGALVRESDVRAQNFAELRVLFADVRREFPGAEDKGAPVLTVTVTAKDGAQRTIESFWEFATSAFVPLPGCDFVVSKRGFGADSQPERNYKVWKWAVLLSKLGPDGEVVRANRIQVQRGAWFDGCYVRYEDGTQEVMGPKMHANGSRKNLGGNEKMVNIKPGEKIVRAYVRASEYRPDWIGQFSPVVDEHQTRDGAWTELKPSQGEVIIGFYGRHQQDNEFCPTLEIGILTIPEGATLPLEAYSLDALNNTDGGIGQQPCGAGPYMDPNAEEDEDEDGEGDDDDDDDDEIDE
ncbi:putative peptidase family-domain-containing protein [Gloeopeniophorella convolvens]|nr:putative peptidase family-domain-containing protein [Gloeopeniophorella convolvens]